MNSDNQVYIDNEHLIPKEDKLRLEQAQRELEAAIQNKDNNALLKALEERELERVSTDG